MKTRNVIIVTALIMGVAALTWGGVFIRDEGGSSILKQGKLELTVTDDDYCKLTATGIDDDGQKVTVIWEGPMTLDPTDY